VLLEKRLNDGGIFVIDREYLYFLRINVGLEFIEDGDLPDTRGAPCSPEFKDDHLPPQ